MIVDVYPQLSEMVNKFGRVHHKVNYKPFKKNKLIRVNDYDDFVKKEINNYGMKLISVGKNK